MSYACSSPTPPAQQGGRDAAQEQAGGEHHLSANAEAWRRLAVVGYHRAAAMVRAKQPASPPHDAGDTDDNRSDAPPADAHQSGFQSL
nr:hypothetical protein [uncultured Rhodoferax sp.]